MDFTACILKPRGPLHLGEREGMREGTDIFVRSDTLFSALCHSLLLLQGRGELERFLAAAAGNDPPVRLSSAFPCWKGEYYLPVPRSLRPRDKSARRLKFLPKSLFERLLSGAEVPDLAAQGIPREGACPWRTDDVPKVTLSRLSGTTGEGGFFHVGLVSYEPGAELFFLADFVAPEWKPKLEAAVRLLADEGIGGYRTAGKGCFEPPRWEPLSLKVPDAANGWLALALYYPADGEIAGLGDGFYDLLTRSGYVFSPECRSLRRKTVRMFGEGSVFPGGPRRGRLVDVTPDGFTSHRVYRNGIGLGVPCSLPAVGALRKEAV